MRVVVHSEQELLELAKELLYVLANLRYWSNEWHLHHGRDLLERKKLWEDKADKLLTRLKTARSVHKYDVHIKPENNDTPQTPNEIQ